MLADATLLAFLLIAHPPPKEPPRVLLYSPTGIASIHGGGMVPNRTELVFRQIAPNQKLKPMMSVQGCR
jgi:hypothetical protein